ncbi:MAG: TPM domain-containing protein [Candidatus Aenigmatarchaeota archaeon]
MKNTIIILFLFSVVYALDTPNLTKYVNDFSNILSDDCEREINNLANSIEKQTSAEIAIVTMNTLCDENICEDLEKYSNDLFRKNGIGKKDKDNGLMILVFVEDRRYRIEVGYGLEDEIPDLLASQIAENYMTPFFKRGDYCSGLYNAVFQFGQAIKGEKNSTLFILEEDSMKTKQQEKESKITEIIIIIIFLVFIIIVFYLSIKNKRRSNISVFIKARGDSSSGGFGGGSSGGGGASGKW